MPRRVCLVANPYKGLPASTMDRDTVTRVFDDERAVDWHHHKGEQVYWGNFHNIHNTCLPRGQPIQRSPGIHNG